ILDRKNLRAGKPEAIGGVLGAGESCRQQAEGDGSFQHSWKDACRVPEFNFFEARFGVHASACKPRERARRGHPKGWTLSRLECFSALQQGVGCTQSAETERCRTAPHGAALLGKEPRCYKVRTELDQQFLHAPCLFNFARFAL